LKQNYPLFELTEYFIFFTLFTIQAIQSIVFCSNNTNKNKTVITKTIYFTLRYKTKMAPYYIINENTRIINEKLHRISIYF